MSPSSLTSASPPNHTPPPPARQAAFPALSAFACFPALHGICWIKAKEAIQKPKKGRLPGAATVGVPSGDEPTTKEATMEREKWAMPGWMRKYALSFCNTGGTYGTEEEAVPFIEGLMNDRSTNAFNNSIRMALITSVNAQVGLLNALRAKGVA